jgi:putative NADH-flavin reductase
LLAAIVRQAVESEIDMEAYAAALVDEREQRSRLAAWAERLESLEGD